MAPVHTYAASGTVTVTLTVTDDQGATSTRTGAVSPLLSNVPPTAAVGSSCLGRTCTFDSAGSSDSDGSIVSYAWDLGDGTSSTDAVVEHTYGANGTYTVSLLVTDDRGGTAVDTEQVSVTAAVAAVAFRDKAGTQVNASVATVRVPSTVRSGDGLLLFASVAGNTTIGDPSGAGWSRVGGPTTTGSLVTQMWQKVALAGDAGATASVTLPAAFKMTLELVAYSGTDQGSPVATASARGDVAATTDHATPTGQVDQSGTAVVSYWADKSSSTTAWTAPAGVSVRDTQLGTGSGRATSLVADSTGVGTGATGGLVATTDAASRATAMTVVLKAAVGANQLPTAAFSASCAGRDCTFDGTASSDGDGFVTSYAWAFGDGATATGPSPTHTYASGGSFSVTLTVTDNSGGSADRVKDVNVVANPASIGFKGQASTQANGSSATLTVPAAVQPGGRARARRICSRSHDARAPAGWTAHRAAATRSWSAGRPCSTRPVVGFYRSTEAIAIGRSRAIAAGPAPRSKETIDDHAPCPVPAPRRRTRGDRRVRTAYAETHLPARRRDAWPAGHSGSSGSPRRSAPRPIWSWSPRWTSTIARRSTPAWPRTRCARRAATCAIAPGLATLLVVEDAAELASGRAGARRYWRGVVRPPGPRRISGPGRHSGRASRPPASRSSPSTGPRRSTRHVRLLAELVAALGAPSTPTRPAGASS